MAWGGRVIAPPHEVRHLKGYELREGRDRLQERVCGCEHKRGKVQLLEVRREAQDAVLRAFIRGKELPVDMLEAKAIHMTELWEQLGHPVAEPATAAFRRLATGIDELRGRGDDAEVADTVGDGSGRGARRVQRLVEARAIVRSLELYRLKEMQARRGDPSTAGQTACDESVRVIPEIVNDMVAQLGRQLSGGHLQELLSMKMFSAGAASYSP